MRTCRIDRCKPRYAGKKFTNGATGNILWIWNFSDVINHLPAAQGPAQRLPVHRVDVVYRDVITRSRDLCDHHYDAPIIFRVKKSLLIPNNTFFHSDADRR